MKDSVKVSKIERILLVRPDAIGDVVLIIPAIIALKNRYPSAEISVLLRSYTADLLRNHPAVSDVIVDSMAEGRVHGKRGFWKYVQELKAKRFDAAVYFFNKSSYAMAGMLAGIPIRIGDRSKLLYGWMYTEDIYQNWKDLTHHEVEHNLDLVKALGAKTDNPEMKIYYSNDDKKIADDLLLEAGVTANNIVAGIHLGTGGGNKPWHPEGYAAVINKLAEEFNIRWVITGGKHEVEIAATLIKQLQQPVINLVGRTTLGQLVALMSRYNLYIGVDTGPLHIAAALKIPTVLISPTKYVKPARWGPWGTRQVLVRKPIDCPLVCAPRTCSDERCLPLTTAEEVVDAAKTLMRGEGNATRKEIFEDWCRKSFNLLVMDFSQDDNGIQFAKAISNQEINLVYASTNLREVSDIKSERLSGFSLNYTLIRKLVDIIVKYDINIIHFTGRKAPLWFKIVSLWSAIYIPIPPLVINGLAVGDPEKTNWLDYYIEKFRNR